MSRYTYAGPFRNPSTNFFVKTVGEHYEIWVRHERAADGSCEADRPHTKGLKFDEMEDAEQWIEDTHEFFEEDYSNYLEENRFEIARMEQFEAFRNEF